MYSSKILSLSVVKRPFRTNGVYYPVGSIIKDPTGIRLYKTKVKEGKILVVTEQNYLDIARLLYVRYGVDIQEELSVAIAEVKQSEEVQQAAAEETKKQAEYLEKVKRFAAEFKVDMEGRDIADVVAEIKQKQAAARNG